MFELDLKLVTGGIQMSKILRCFHVEYLVIYHVSFHMLEFQLRQAQDLIMDFLKT